MKRRTFLRSAAVGGTGVALGGCLGFGGDGGSSVEISSIELLNSDTQAHTADVTVEESGDTVHDDSYDLEADGGSTTIEDIPEDSGDYLIRVELQDSDAEVFEQSPAELTEADCISHEIEILSGDPPTITQDATACNDTNSSG
jgi:hypothetical protein